MDFTGRIYDVSMDYKTKRPIIQFVINENPNGIEDLNNKDLKIKITKVTKPRSLDANAYFHVLCDKLRQVLGISMARCKNHLIADYGQVDYISEGEPLFYKTNAPEDNRLVVAAQRAFVYPVVVIQPTLERIGTLAP